MCGYCIEQEAFQALQSASRLYMATDMSSLSVMLYLQEDPDLLSALKLLDMQKVCNQGVASIITYRAIEMLVSHGFDSDAYQKLLAQPKFTAAILAGCSYFETLQTNKSACQFKVQNFRWLGDKEIYLTADRFTQLNAQLSDIEISSLLRDYIDWWLEGGSVSHQDPSLRFEETGVLDSIEDISSRDRDLFDRDFPSFWLAFHRLPNLPESDSILLDMIIREPSGVPGFDGLDLWLQRRATLAYYDLHGFSAFLDHIGEIRPELFQYLAIARVIKIEDKKQFFEQIATLESFCNDDYHPSEWIWKDDLPIT